MTKKGSLKQEIVVPNADLLLGLFYSKQGQNAVKIFLCDISGNLQKDFGDTYAKALAIVSDDITNSGITIPAATEAGRYNFGQVTQGQFMFGQIAMLVACRDHTKANPDEHIAELISNRLPKAFDQKVLEQIPEFHVILDPTSKVSKTDLKKAWEKFAESTGKPIVPFTSAV